MSEFTVHKLVLLGNLDCILQARVKAFKIPQISVSLYSKYDGNNNKVPQNVVKQFREIPCMVPNVVRFQIL